MTVLIGYAFIFGAIIGSFLNVCIYRLPARMSLMTPPSTCPCCNTRIAWYYNLPVVGYLVLRGRCAQCRQPISFRYPAVEILTGLLFAWAMCRFGIHLMTPVFCVFIAALVTITFIDLDCQIIPDVISLPGIILGFAGSFVVPWVSWQDSVMGILFGYGVISIIAWSYEQITGREGMGMGDAKLLAMVGALLGLKAVFMSLFFGSILCSVIGLPLALRKGGQFALPFGPFLALGALIALFFGQQIMNWYLPQLGL